MAILTCKLKALLALVWLCGTAATCLGAEVPHTDAEVKAAFLFNFGSFAEWPNQPAPEQPFRIGVCGDANVASALEALVQGEKILGRPIQILRVRNAVEAKTCQILHVAAGQENTVGLEALAAQPILTCGESDRFEAKGGMFRFVPERNRIRLRVYVGRTTRAGLRINSQLLRICETRDLP